MAVTITPNRTGLLLKTWDITWTIDADVNAFFNHGFVDEDGNGVTPEVWFNVINARTTLGGNVWAVSADATQIFALKANTAGSADSSPQIRVIAWNVHTLVDDGPSSVGP